MSTPPGQDPAPALRRQPLRALTFAGDLAGLALPQRRCRLDYVYCVGGFNCTYPAARMQALAQCRRYNPGEECKIYAVRRSVVWQDADRVPQLSANDRLLRECLEGDTPEIRIDQCSHAIASPELVQSQKRGPFYVRARAYEQIGRMPEAEQDYRAVFGIDPNHIAEGKRGAPDSGRRDAGSDRAVEYMVAGARCRHRAARTHDRGACDQGVAARATGLYTRAGARA